MKIGLILRPKGTAYKHDPGHLMLYFRDPSGEKTYYRGFYFNPENLIDPDGSGEDYSEPERWREYLFDNKTPGVIKNDFRGKKLAEKFSEKVLKLDWEIDDENFQHLVAIAKPREFEHYSFNPETNKCHNCITWAITLINYFIPNEERIPNVREGRIKHIIKVFDRRRIDSLQTRSVIIDRIQDTIEYNNSAFSRVEPRYRRRLIIACIGSACLGWLVYLLGYWLVY